ncbi:MAG: hypothetical protein A2W28_08575 [Gammaproteobacteria bacterium RBG_16_51_14]|nr:MAG: hypothetical protein A2W28_08575 [Gammaproteobacteria bacterium RBG_16_51_14]
MSSYTTLLPEINQGTFPVANPDQLLAKNRPYPSCTGTHINRGFPGISPGFNRTQENHDLEVE